MSYKDRLLKRGVNMSRTLSAEDGKLYRGVHQEMAPILERVKYLDEKVNQSSQINNENDMAYIGSPGMVMVWEFLNEKGYTWPQLGCDKTVRAEMIAWLKSKYPHVMAQTKRQNSILMPGVNRG